MVKLSTILIGIYIALLITSGIAELFVLTFAEPIKINVSMCYKQLLILYNILYLTFFSQLIYILLNFVVLKYWSLSENGTNQLFEIIGRDKCITVLKILIIFYNIFHASLFSFVVFQKFCPDTKKMLILILCQFVSAFLPFLYSFVFFLYYKIIYQPTNDNQIEPLESDIQYYNGMFHSNDSIV